MDSTGFKEKVCPCLDSMYRVALALCGNRDDASDAVQDASLKLWKRRDTLDTVVNIEAYAIGTVRNVCLDMLASRKNSLRLDEAVQISDGTDLSDSLDRKEASEIIISLAGRLPGNQRTVLVMRDIEGCEMEEIEKVTGLTSGNIRVLLSRARTSIRKYFGK